MTTIERLRSTTRSSCPRQLGVEGEQSSACSRVASRSPYNTRSKSRAASHIPAAWWGYAARSASATSWAVARALVEATLLDLAGGEGAERVDERLGVAPLCVPARPARATPRR